MGTKDGQICTLSIYMYGKCSLGVFGENTIPTSWAQIPCTKVKFSRIVFGGMLVLILKISLTLLHEWSNDMAILTLFSHFLFKRKQGIQSMGLQIN